MTDPVTGSSSPAYVEAGPVLAHLNAAITRGPGPTVVRQLLALPASRYAELIAGEHLRYPDQPPIRHLPAAEAQLLASLPVHPTNSTRATPRPGRPPRRRDPVLTIHRTLYLGGCRCADCVTIIRWYARAAYARRNGKPDPPRPALAGHHDQQIRATIRPVVYSLPT